ncbi:MAG: hypothetical protein ACRDHZ_07365 [Ktedonobacteraceae bacterium]
MTHRISVERIRRAAESLRTEGVILHCANLARRVGADRRFLCRYLDETRPELREELGIKRSRGTDWRSPTLFTAYINAAREVRENGDLPCYLTLSAKLKWRRKRVIRYLREHPELSEWIMLYSDDEALLHHSARIILARGERVTRLGLADEIKRGYQTVLRVLKAHPEWVEDLGICRARRNSGVWKRLYPKRSS